jgi:hypothetical protein
MPLPLDAIPLGPVDIVDVHHAFPLGSFRLPSGEQVRPPVGWELLPPGDAMLTRRVKAAGPHWTVSEQKGRKVFSRGIVAPRETIAAARAEVEREKADPAYAQRLESARRRREVAEVAYRDSFQKEVLEFLAFAPQHGALAARLARAVTDHATPVGSGTVARTQRISVQERAEAAVIAWMRHQTTAYDHLVIERRKGARREVRRDLARVSRGLLDRYRAGAVAAREDCPLRRALGDDTQGDP